MKINFPFHFISRLSLLWLSSELCQSILLDIHLERAAIKEKKVFWRWEWEWILTSSLLETGSWESAPEMMIIFNCWKVLDEKKKNSVHKHVHLDVYHGHGDRMEANSSQLFWLPCYVMEKITRQQQKKRENDSRGRCRCFCWSSRSKISSIWRL